MLLRFVRERRLESCITGNLGRYMPLLDFRRGCKDNLRKRSMLNFRRRPVLNFRRRRRSVLNFRRSLTVVRLRPSINIMRSMVMSMKRSIVKI